MPTPQRPAEPERRLATPEPRPSVDPVVEELWRVKDERAEQFVDARRLVAHLRAKFPASPTRS